MERLSRLSDEEQRLEVSTEKEQPYANEFGAEASEHVKDASSVDGMDLGRVSEERKTETALIKTIVLSRSRGLSGEVPVWLSTMEARLHRRVENARKVHSFHERLLRILDNLLQRLRSLAAALDAFSRRRRRREL